MIESVSLKDSIKDCWWVWVKRDILERMESTGNDERESEKEVESMQDKLPFGNVAGTEHTEAVE